MLLGIPGDNTYANYAEANRAFWRQTVLPLVNRTARAMSGWLAPAFGGELRLAPDIDAVEALSPEREALWARVGAAAFLTDAEKRVAVGYGETEGGDRASRKFNPYHADDGRFDFAPNGAAESESEFVPTAGRGPRGPSPPAPKAPQPQSQAPKQPSTVPIPPGTTIRNKDLAGKKHPDTGVPFDKDGFPDFSGVAQSTVRVPHTGTATDVSAANRAAGFMETPRGMTWHHHQDGHTMQLVPADVHRGTGHTGSRGIGNLPGRR